MKNLIKTLLLAGTIGLLGCGQTKIEYSDVLHEDAVVVDKTYTPKDMELVLHTKMGTGGVGFDAGGDMIYLPKNVSEKYKVTIKSEKSTFEEQGSDSTYKKLYNKLEKGQKVDVSYREVYNAFYKDTNHDKKKELVRKKLVDIKFLDANPKDK